MKRLFLAIGLALVLGLIPTASSAIEYGGVGGVPANPREDNPRTQSIFIYELNPGDSYQDGVKINNNTGETATIDIGAVDSRASNDGAFACAQEADDKIDVGSWVKLDQTQVTLASGEEEVVDFTITVPENASVGEHGGCITIMQANQQPSTTSGGIALSFRSAIRIAVTIPGDIVKAVNVSSVSLEPNKGDDSKYIIKPGLTNSGNVSLDTKITSKLVSLFGVVSASTTSTYPVLPATSASWNFDVDRPFWGGFYRADVDATYNSNTSESLGQTSDASDEITVSGQSGYVFITPSPLALAIELIILAAFLIALFLLGRRLTHRRTVKKHWRHHTVEEGESLQKIAKHYHVSWKKLATANRIRAPYHVEPGDKLKVPPNQKKA